MAPVERKGATDYSLGHPKWQMSPPNTKLLASGASELEKVDTRILDERFIS